MKFKLHFFPNVCKEYPVMKKMLSLMCYKYKRFEDWKCRSVVLCLPNMHKILGLIPSNAKLKKRKKSKRLLKEQKRSGKKTMRTSRKESRLPHTPTGGHPDCIYFGHSQVDAH